MKKTFKYVLLVMSLLLTPVMWSCSNDDDDDYYSQIVTVKELPSAAQSFITEYFASSQIYKIEKDYDRGVVVYDVDFKDGYEVTFNQTGEWVEVDAPDGKSIPAGIVPAPIHSYVTANYPDYGINDITKTGSGYEVELVTGVELIFNQQGDFVRVDYD